MKKENYSLGQFRAPRNFPLRLSLGYRSCRHLIAALLALSLPLAYLPAAQLREARVSQVIKDVKLLQTQAAPRPARLSDEVREGTAIRTGIESRAELTFTDQTLARLGANTIFSFNEGTRNLDLGGGAMLLRVPKNAGGAQIHTAAVTAAITGTTVLLEYHANAYIKFIVLEGTGRMFRKDHVGESVLVHAGQMLIVNPKGTSLPDPVDVDISRLSNTSALLSGDFAPIPSLTLIQREIQVQTDQKTSGGLVDTNLVIFGGGTVISLLDPTNTDVVNQANSNSERQPTPTPGPTSTPAPTPSPSPSPTFTPTPTPTPSPSPTATPGKYGTPTPISSPVPYVISSGTTIQTDPTITTNGVTDFGKIYRGPTDDGPLSAWLFGATSPFDTQIGFDSFFSVSANLPLAALKFLVLSLTGNPTIAIAEGGPTELALVSVGDITSGPPGGTLTFSGLDLLLLATQNGSITLTSDLAFQDIATLGIYARGAGSILTLDSTVSGTTDFALASEGSILFNNAFSLTGTNVAGSQLNVDFQAGGDLTASNGLTINLDNSAGGVLNASTQAQLTTGGNMTLNGGNGLSLTISNNDGGHILGDASLTVSAGGNLTASAISLLINNRNAGAIDGEGTVSINTSGAITTTGDATLVISCRDDGGGAGVISGNASVILTAGSANVGGFFLTGISEATGGQLESAFATMNVAGNITTGGGLQFSVQNGGFNPILGQEGGGTINQDAFASLTATNVTTGDFFAGLIANLDGGQIGGNAAVTAFLTGNVNAQGDATFQIDNSTSMGTLSSSIGSNATIGVTANNFTAGSLDAQIFNQAGGSIGGSATVGFGVAGAITCQAGAVFEIDNYDDDSGFGGGVVGGTASVSVAANSLSAASLIAQINNLGGTIGGDALIDLNVSGSATIATDATVQILGSDSTAAAAINLNGGSYDAGGTFLALIDGSGAIAFNNASVHADVLKVGALGTNGVLNIGGGTLSADTTLKLYASGSNGQLNFISNVTLGGNSAKILAANSITILNNVVVTIGGANPADVYTGFTGNIPNANYSGFGGNGSTNGTFAGAGANNPQPIANAPPFDGPDAPLLSGDTASAKVNAPTSSPANVLLAGNLGDGNRRKGAREVMKVTDSDQLLSLLQGAPPRPAGKITIPASRTTRNGRNSNRINAAARLSTDRHAVDLRTAFSFSGRPSP